MPDFYAYLYVDPRDSLPFYIGKGQKYRAHKHLHQATNKGVAARLADLRALDIRPEIIKLSCLSEAHAFELERQLIECYGRAVDGGPLCNVLEAGERSGGFAGRRHSEESKAKIRAAMQARVMTADHKEKIRAKARLRTFPPHARERQIAAMKRPEVRAKLAAASRVTSARRKRDHAGRYA